MRVIYKDGDTVCVLIPSKRWTKTIDELAKKDVPKGSKYKIVEDSVIPTDRSFRNAWEIDDSELTDGVGE